MKKNVFLFITLFSFTVSLIAMEKDNSKITNLQNQININNQTLDSGQSDSIMQIDHNFSTSTKTKREELERGSDACELGSRAEDSQDSEFHPVTKKQKIDIETKQDEQTEKLETSNVDSLKSLAAKKMADYLVNPEVYSNFKFNPERLHQELKDDIVYYLYKYHSNKLWEIAKKDDIVLTRIVHSTDKTKIDYPTSLQIDFIAKENFNISNDEQFITFLDKTDLKIYYLANGFSFILKTNDGDSLLLARISENSRFIVTGYESGLAKIWDIKSGLCVYILNFNEPVNAVEISKNNKFFVISDWNGVVKIVDIEKKAEITFKVADEFPCTIKLSQDSKLGFIETNDYVFIIELESGKIVNEIDISGMTEITVNMCPINKLIITYNDDTNCLETWDANSGQKIYKILHCNSPIAISKDEKFLITVFEDGNLIAIRDLKSGKCLKIIRCNDKLSKLHGIENIEMTLNDKEFLIQEPFIRNNSEIWNFKSNHYLKKIDGIASISQDKKIIFIAGSNSIQLLDTDSWGKCLQFFKLLNPDKNYKLYISNNNKYIVVWTDRIINIWKNNLNSSQIISKFYSELKDIQDLNNQIHK